MDHFGITSGSLLAYEGRLGITVGMAGWLWTCFEVILVSILTYESDFGVTSG